VRIK